MNKRDVKNILRNSFLFNIIHSYYKKKEDEKLFKLRSPYIDSLREFIDNDTTIISSNCFAGRVMQDLNIKYNSPTLGLYFMYPDYIEFLQHLEFYLKDAKIQFVEHSKYLLGDQRRANWKHWYPIGLLGGKVEIHFLHYYTEKEAEMKWYRRVSRVNFNKLIVIGMEQNRCTIDDILAFDTLPIKNKIIFTTKKLETRSNIFISEFEKDGIVGDPYKKGHVFYQYFVKWLLTKSR